MAIAAKKGPRTEETPPPIPDVVGHEQPRTRHFPCGGCGAGLSYSPGTSSLTCPYCGHSQELPWLKGGDTELDFRAWLDKAGADGLLEERLAVDCSGCGASVEPDPEVTAMNCPFCGTSVDLRGESRRLIKPAALLPFTVDTGKARELFRDWVTSLWFAPDKLKSTARRSPPLNGIYVPYWTFDAQTESTYQGQRGTHYLVTESYSAVENGQSVTKTRTVTKTRWSPVSGRLSLWFDDLPVMACKALPRSLADGLEPWDLQELGAYDPQYVAGFKVQQYDVGLEEGFELAKERMEVVLRERIKGQIGGDEQRIDRLTTVHADITFKHILLPIWISAYRFGDKSYRFLINGRTGEVQGERPYSWVKIGLLVAVAVAIAGATAWFTQ
nr:conserved uncharacterized protein [uncultured bacterium]